MRAHSQFAPAFSGQLLVPLANGLAVSARRNRAMLAWTTAWPGDWGWPGVVQPGTRLRPNCSMIAGQKAGRSAGERLVVN